MNFIKQLMNRIFRSNEVACKSSTDSALRKYYSIRSFNITVYRASTGMVIETWINEPSADDASAKLHIVNDGQDLGDALNKIILIENLKA